MPQPPIIMTILSQSEMSGILTVGAFKKKNREHFCIFLIEDIN